VATAGIFGYHSLKAGKPVIVTTPEEKIPVLKAGKPAIVTTHDGMTIR
jgi:hypothetical protein